MKDYHGTVMEVYDFFRYSIPLNNIFILFISLYHRTTSRALLIVIDRSHSELMLKVTEINFVKAITLKFLKFGHFFQRKNDEIAHIFYVFFLLWRNVRKVLFEVIYLST